MTQATTMYFGSQAQGEMGSATNIQFGKGMKLWRMVCLMVVCACVLHGA